MSDAQRVEIQRVDPAVREMQGIIEKFKPQMADLLPKHLTPERMLRLCRALMSRKPKLAQCSAISVVEAMCNCALVGLEPDTPSGHCFIIPYSLKGKMTAQFQMGYKGYIQLVNRSKQVTMYLPQVVHANDKFRVAYGTEQVLEHVPANSNRGEPIGVYATAMIEGGGRPFVYLTKEEVLKFKARSAAVKSGFDSPWNHAEDQYAMWKKTAVLRLVPYLPQSSEFQVAASADVRADLGQYEVSLLVDEAGAPPAPPKPSDPRQLLEEVTGLAPAIVGAALGLGQVRDRTDEEEEAVADAVFGPSEAPPKPDGELTVEAYQTAILARTGELGENEAAKQKVKEVMTKHGVPSKKAVKECLDVHKLKLVLDELNAIEVEGQ